jgi:hypothetical protein
VAGHLALDALQRVVDRLLVPVEPLGDLLVGAALEVHRQDAALERRKVLAQAPDQALQLLR